GSAPDACGRRRRARPADGRARSGRSWTAVPHGSGGPAPGTRGAVVRPAVTPAPRVGSSTFVVVGRVRVVRLTILGGGGFRVPLVYGALLADHAEGRVTRVVLHDVDAGRLRAIARVLAEQADGVPDAPRVTTTTDLDEALRGADFVFAA